jgi:transcription elongation GreA/GreB family factor
MLAAAVVDSDQLAPDVVTGTARITFALDRQPAETRVLYHWSYPDDAHRRLRVGSPLGVTLIGMTAGQSSGWLDRSGTPRNVQVLSVAPNAP